jgi:hypothetical protein
MGNRQLDRSARWSAPFTRRELLRGAGLGALALVAAACSGGNPGPPTPLPSPGTIRYLRKGATRLSLLNDLGKSKEDAIQPGKSFYFFDLSTPGGQLVTGGRPQVVMARDENSQVLGPFDATWNLFTGYDKTGDRSPRSPIPGVYWAEIDVLNQPGIWTFAVTVDTGGSKGIGVGSSYVGADVLAAVGSKATSAPTPVATSPKDLAKVCTRNPPCDLHGISLDHALRNGKPTVVSFATPLFCTSKLCGPVVDEQILVSRTAAGARANVIHVEEFPTRDVSKPAPAFVAWGFHTEPWVVLIDRGGIIRARFEGPSTADMIETALRPLL